MKTAQQVAEKMVRNAGNAVQDYKDGVQNTTKDQAALAVGAQTQMLAAVTKAVTSGRWAKNLQAAGKAAWQKGVQEKGGDRFATGVATSANKYATNSGRYDGARNSSAGMPKGEKGSATNLLKVATVVGNLRKQKVGSVA